MFPEIFSPMNKQPLLIGIVGSTIILVGLLLFIQSNRGSRTTPEKDSKKVVVAPTRTPAVQSGNTELRDPYGINALPEDMQQSKAKTDDFFQKVEPERSLDEEDLFDPETLARLVAEYGGIPELYKALSEEQRMSLIDSLNLTDTLRDHIAGILPLEQSTDIRSFMLFRVQPNTFGVSDDPQLQEDVDYELMAILDQPTASPIGADEFIARMDLGTFMDSEYGLNWVRSAAAAYPEEMNVSVKAAELTLKIGATVDSVSSQERQQAQNHLMETLLAKESEKLPATERVSAYMGLYWSEDKKAALDFFKERLPLETDSKAQGKLQELIQRLEASK